jgi:hypothetical protein
MRLHWTDVSTNSPGLFGLLLPVCAKTTKANPLLTCGIRLALNISCFHLLTLATSYDGGNDDEAWLTLTIPLYYITRQKAKPSSTGPVLSAAEWLTTGGSTGAGAPLLRSA